jgi:hypothetical protein
MQQWGQTPEDGKGESIAVIRALALFAFLLSSLLR